MEEHQIENILLDKSLSQANAYGSTCVGCVATGSDIMLAFGSILHRLDGNNNVEKTMKGVLDIFLTEDQARHLHAKLTQRLAEIDVENIKKICKL